MANIRDEMRAWVATATINIRFKPDREAVARELEEHIEDRYLDIQRIFPNMSEEEVLARTMKGMGDRYEIARELGRIHKPWLGYLWRFSQILLALAVFVSFASAMFYGIDRFGYETKEIYENWAGYYRIDMEIFGNEVPEDCRRLALYHPNAERRQGNCTISVPRAALYQEGEEAPALYLEIELKFDYPWLKSLLPYSYLWAEDNLGNQYMTQGYATTGHEPSGLTWMYRCVILKDFPEGVDWLRFRYIEGTDFDLKVDLTKEVRG